MFQIQHFFASLTVEQIALALGALTWAVHTLIDSNKTLSKPINLFIVRFTSFVVPIATALAVDPNISALVHNYFPALLGFFTAYQGLYQASQLIVAKWTSLRQLAAGDQTA